VARARRKEKQVEIKRSGSQPSGIAIVEKLDGKNADWMEQIIGE
jgi:hypothetical protein